MISLNALLQSLWPYLDRYAKAKRDWQVIEKTMWMTQHRRFRFEEFGLGCEPSQLWQFFPSRGVMQLAELTFCGLPENVPMNERVQALKALMTTQEAHFRAAMQCFLGNLQRDVLNAVRSSSIEAPISDYNLFFPDRKERVRYRSQAAKVAPLLGLALCDPGVDAGKPLWPLYSRQIGVPEEVIRWMRGKTIDDVGLAWAGRIFALLRILAKVPPEKRPCNDEAWGAFTAFCRQCIGGRMYDQWLHDLARIGWVVALRQVRAMRALPSDIPDIKDLLDETVRAISQELQSNRERRFGLRNAVEKAFFEVGVMRQLRASLRWHQLQRMAAEEHENSIDADSEDSWLAPVDQPLVLEHGGLTAHFLTTPSQLAGEGRRLQHCVGNYATSCLHSNVSIVSFRNSDGRSVSTAELWLQKCEQRFVFDVRQHCSIRNGPPSSEAEDALATRIEAGDRESLVVEIVGRDTYAGRNGDVAVLRVAGDFLLQPRFQGLRDFLATEAVLGLPEIVAYPLQQTIPRHRQAGKRVIDLHHLCIASDLAIAFLGRCSFSLRQTGVALALGAGGLIGGLHLAHFFG